MPQNPSAISGSGGASGPLPSGSSDESKSTTSPEGKLGRFRVKKAKAEKQINVEEPNKPKKARKKLSDFGLKALLPGSGKKPGKASLSREQFEAARKQLSEGQGLQSLDADGPRAARELVLKPMRNLKSWKKLEKGITKHGNETSKKGFNQLLKSMEKMSFKKKADEELMSYFAMDMFHKGRFTPDQMKQYMTVFIDKHVEARVAERVDFAVKQLPASSTETVVKGASEGTAKAVGMAELITEVTGGKKEGALEAAYNAMASSVHYDLYDKESGFMLGLMTKFEPKVEEIDAGVSEALGNQLKGMLRELSLQSPGRVKLSQQQQRQMAADVDRVIKHSIEKQLREKRTRAYVKGEDILGDKEAMIHRLTELKASMVTLIEQQVAEGFNREEFEKTKVEDYFDQTAQNWIDNHFEVKMDDYSDNEKSADSTTSMPSQTTPVTEPEVIENKPLQDDLLSDITEALTKTASEPERSVEKQEAREAAAQLLKRPPEVKPKPKRPPATKQADVSTDKPQNPQSVEGETDHSSMGRVEQLIRQHEQMIKDHNSPKPKP